MAKEITIQATEHDSAHEAIQYLDVSADDCAVLLGGKYLTMPQADADKLESLGAKFACLVWHEPTGRIMTIPANDG